MNKKKLISIPLGVVLSLLIVVVVLAGTTSDIGTLAGTPPAGDANWTAWVNVYDFSGEIPALVYPPAAVLTEDNSNAAGGENLGYTNAGWFIQVENLQDAVNGARITMSFGGLNSYSGSHWYSSWLWDGKLVSETSHGEVPLTTSTGPACPTIYPYVTDTTLLTNTVTFWGSPNTTYHVYRSTSPSGTTPPNGASNGRYKLQGEATTTAYGVGTFVDSTPGITEVPSWYIIMYFGTSPTLGLQGCHSEPSDPTAVEVSDFTATFATATGQVDLNWTSVSDLGLSGFNILRSESEDGERVQVNSELIDVYQIGSNLGGHYSYVDSTVDRGKTYYYWLEISEIDATVTTFGPVSITTSYTVYLPLMVR